MYCAKIAGDDGSLNRATSTDYEHTQDLTLWHGLTKNDHQSRNRPYWIDGVPIFSPSTDCGLSKIQVVRVGPALNNREGDHAS